MQTGEANGRHWGVRARDRAEGQFAASLRIAARARCRHFGALGNPINAIKRIVRVLRESRDLRDPDRGVVVFAEGCRLDHVARGEQQIDPVAHRRDCERWRVASLDRG